jgi:lipopolysaccharide biosynthesis glycosyltransferase
MDCDVLVRTNLFRLFEYAQTQTKYAVLCVKHHHEPPAGVKMDGQEQTRYARKNWSSVMLFNLAHHANKELTPELVNTLPGRDLHRFCWLADDEIGELGPEWNYLVRHTKADVDPKIVHFTDGYPLMAGYENDAFADEWRAELRAEAAA